MDAPPDRPEIQSRAIRLVWPRTAAYDAVPMERANPIRLVCFDVGGVLVRICRSWPEGCAAAGLPIRGTMTKGYPQAPGWDELGFQFGTGKIDGTAWAQQMSGLLNGLYTPQEIHSIHDAWLLDEYEGVGDVIDQIHAAGIQTAALSNTNADHWPRMDEFPAVMRLQQRLASHEMGLHKPDPAIYRELERRLNRRGPEILFLDDLSGNVEAARAVGWNAVLIDPSGRTDVQIQSALISHGVLSRKAPGMRRQET